MAIDLPATGQLYLRPTRFVDTPVGQEGAVARLAGGLCWFAAYELIAVEGGRRVLQASVPVAELPEDPRLSALAARITGARAPLVLGARTLRFDQPHAMGILNMTPDSFTDGGGLIDDPERAAQAGVDMGTAGAAIDDVG